PASPLLLNFYGEFYGANGDYMRHVSLLQQAMRAVKSDLQRTIEITRIIADISSKNNPEKAIDVWKRILKKDPKNQEARSEIKKLYAHTEKWPALLDLYKDEEHTLPKEDHAGLIALLIKMADLVEAHMGVDAMVVNIYTGILKLDPDHTRAQDALIEKYSAMGRWKDVISRLQDKAEKTNEIDEKKRHLKAIADLWMERLSNPNKAAEPLEHILELDPTDREVIESLKTIYEARRNWKGLYDLRRKEIELIPEEERLEHLVELAKFAQQPLGNMKLAIDTWNRILEIDEYDLDALEALIYLYEREKRYPALVEVLRRQISMSTDEEALPLYEKAGSLLTDKMHAMGPLSMEIWRRVHELKPGHPKAMKILKDLYSENKKWEELEALFAERENWLGYIETLSHAADATTDPNESIELNFKVADTYAEKLGKPERAIKPYEKILKTDPENARAAEQLLPLYESSKKWKYAVQMYEILLNNSPGELEQQEWIEKLIQVNEEELRKPEEAFRWCGIAYRLDPADEANIERLERFAGASQSWEALADIYEESLAHLEGQDLFDACGRLARVYVDELTELERGEATWKRVIKEDERNEQALKGLAYILEIEEKWEDLNQILTQQIEISEDPLESLWAREKLANISEHQLGDRDHAVALYKEILEIDPAYMPALNALDALYENAEQWDLLATILDVKMELEEEPEKCAALNFRMGHLYFTNLKDLGRALDHFAAVLEHDPKRAGAIAFVREILDLDQGPVHGVRAAKLLLDFYEEEERWEDFSVALETIARFEENHTTQVENYRRLISITTKKVGDMSKGFALALALFKLEPSDEENRNKVRSLARLDGQLDTLKASYLEFIEEDRDGLKLTLAWEVALMEEEDNANLEEAEKYFLLVLEEDHLHEGAFLALERLFTTAERWENTRTLYENRISALTDSEQQKEMLLKLAMLNEERLTDIDAAIDAYRAVRQLEPGAPIAFDPLVRLYDVADRWEELADLYGTELQYHEAKSERVTLLYNQCDLFLHRLNKPEESVGLVQEILALESEHEPTRQLLLELLEITSTRQSVARILEELFESENNFEELIRMLEIKLEAAEDDLEAVDVLSKEGRILTEQMAEPEKAFQAWRRALSRDPSNLQVRTAIEQLAIVLNSYTDLVEVWKEAIAATDKEDPLVLLYLEKIALIYEKQLAEPQEAIVWYRKLLEAAKEEHDLQSKAALALINLYSSIGEWIEIIELHKRQLSWTDWDEERKNIYRKIANLQEDMLDAPEEAAQTYNDLLEEFPEDNEAIERLESIYSRIEKWAELVSVLTKKVELSLEPQMRISCLSRIAILREESLQDIEGASDAWSEILNEDPNNDEALRYLARLNEVLERWADVFEYVERELTLTTDPEEQRSLRYRLGYILQVHLEEPERAITYYETVLEEDPEHVKAKMALEAMLQGEESLALSAAAILETIYEVEDNWEKLTGLYVLKAGYSADPHEKVTLFMKIARIKESDLGEPIAAFGFYGQALKEASAEPELPEILVHMQRLAALEGRWEEMINIYKEVAEEIMDPTIQEQVFLTIADVARDELDDLQTSQKYYESVLENSPENGHALDALERVYEQTQNYEALLGIHLKRAEMALDDEEARFQALVNAATICKTNVKRPDEAIGHYNDILQFRPAESSIFRALEEILFDQESWEALIELYEHRIRYVEELGEAVEIRFNMGEIFMDFLEEHDRALEAFSAALGGDPSDDNTVTRLEKFLEIEEYAGVAAERLIPIYASRQAWSDLIKVISLQR
ncbi:MAG: hypothetical protein CSA75_01575, partial [Sorangium cellulosum]